MKTLSDIINNQSIDNQIKIKDMADEIVLETGLQMLMDELKVSQKKLAGQLGISQPAITQIEQRGNDLKISTLKKYIEAMGGKLSLTVDLPNGEGRVFSI